LLSFILKFLYFKLQYIQLFAVQFSILFPFQKLDITFGFLHLRFVQDRLLLIHLKLELLQRRKLRGSLILPFKAKQSVLAANKN